MFSKAVDETLKDICLEISKRYEIYFLEIGVDKDHVHFLIQSVPMKSPTQIYYDSKEFDSEGDFQKAS